MPIRRVVIDTSALPRQQELVAALRAAGTELVLDTNGGYLCPDIILGALGWLLGQARTGHFCPTRLSLGPMMILWGKLRALPSSMGFMRCKV